MQETLLSILCKETWNWDSTCSNQVAFNRDGTGKLICRFELNVWIAAEFDWKPRDPPSLSQAINASQLDTGLLCQTQIDMTLTRRRIPRLGDADMAAYSINEAVLREGAFLPKTYTISLERGVFVTQFDSVEHDAPAQYTPRFALRLTFDTSPYPPREEWKEPNGAADAMEFWEWKQFCCRQIGCF